MMADRLSMAEEIRARHPSLWRRLKTEDRALVAAV
jgi:hypothetical protein